MHCALSFSFFFFSCLLFHVHETSVPEPTVGSVAGSISGSGTGGSMDGTGGMAGYCLVLLSIYNVYHQGHAKTFPGCGKSYKIKKKMAAVVRRCRHRYRIRISESSTRPSPHWLLLPGDDVRRACLLCAIFCPR